MFTWIVYLAQGINRKDCLGIKLLREFGFKIDEDAEATKRRSEKFFTFGCTLSDGTKVSFDRPRPVLLPPKTDSPWGRGCGPDDDTGLWKYNLGVCSGCGGDMFIKLKRCKGCNFTRYCMNLLFSRTQFTVQ